MKYSQNKDIESLNRINLVKTTLKSNDIDELILKINQFNLSKFKNLPYEIQLLVSSFYTKMNLQRKDNFAVDIINDNKAYVQKYLVTKLNIFNIKYDISTMYSHRNFEMFSAILFYELPENVELELITYDKQKDKKIFGIFQKYNYIETSKTQVKKNMFYLIPNRMYYNFRNKKPLNNKNSIKILWMNIECDYTL
jgi:hypothetical protein